MAQIFLIRHAERSSGDYNSGLNSLGHVQAKKLHKRFKNIEFTKMYISTIDRASQTAKPLLTKREKTKIIFSDLLREVFSNIVGGKKPRDLKREKEDKIRADKAFREVFEKAKKGDRILVVSHGNLIRYFLNRILHTPKSDLWHNLHLDSTSVTIIEGYKTVWTIKTINNVDHLNREYRENFFRKEYERNKSFE
jgi:broad specificity phosphatase PhoE